MTLQRRTHLRNKTPMKPGGWIRQRSPLPVSAPCLRSEKRKNAPCRPPEYVDTEYIAWLKNQACRVTGKAGPNVAHHLRHSETGAALGKNVKDDRRAITLSVAVHVPQLHSNAGFFKGWTKERLRAWENAQLAIQRAQYLAWKAAQEPR